MGINSVIHLRTDCTFAALERKARNTSLSSKTLHKLQDIANREFGFGLGRVFRQGERLEIPKQDGDALAAAAVLCEVLVFKLSDSALSSHMRAYLGQVLARLPVPTSTSTSGSGAGKARESRHNRSERGAMAASRSRGGEHEGAAKRPVDGHSAMDAANVRHGDVEIPAPDFPDDAVDGAARHLQPVQMASKAARVPSVVPESGSNDELTSGEQADEPVWVRRESLKEMQKRVRFDLESNATSHFECNELPAIDRYDKVREPRHSILKPIMPSE